MSESTNVYAKLSSAVYKGISDVYADGVNYKVLDSYSVSSGFYGAIYKDT